MSNFPSLDELKLYVEEERGSALSSSAKSCYRFIVDYFKDKDFTRENVRQMKADLRLGYKGKSPLKGSTIDCYIKVVKLLGWYMDKSFVNSFKKTNKEPSSPLGDMITLEQAFKIANCDMVYPNQTQAWYEANNKKFKALLTLMAYVGTPPVDACGLRWDDDRLTHFDVSRKKTGKRWIIPIVQPVRELLDSLPRHKHGYIFATERARINPEAINNEIRRRCKKLGYTGHITAYSFRYSATQWSYINATDSTFMDLASVFGHTVDTARKYYFTPDIQKLTDALYATHPVLIKHQSIDVIKRLAISFLSKFIDLSEFQVNLEITRKIADKRIVHLS